MTDAADSRSAARPPALPRSAFFGSLLVAAGCLAWSAPAAAQSDGSSGGRPSAERSDWSITLGAGALYRPDYEGSDNYEVWPLPFAAITYRDTLFLRGPSVGANLLNWQPEGSQGKLQAGPLLRYQFGRDDNDNGALDGMGDVDDGLDLGGFITYSLGPWSAGLTALHDVTGAHDGMTAKASVGYAHVISERMRLRSEISTTWASGNYMDSFFGVSQRQSARSGWREYEADSGFKDVGLVVDLSYAITREVGITGRLGYDRLLGDAADSPLVDDAGSANQFSGGAFVTYRF